MIASLQAMAGELRRINIPVATSAVMAAAQALTHVNLSDRSQVRECIAATLIKTQRHRAAFDLLFDLFFAGRVSSEARPFESLSNDELRGLLESMLASGGDSHLLRELAAEAVARFARMQPGRRVAGTFYIFKTLDELNIEDMQELLYEQVLNKSGPLSALEARTQMQIRVKAIATFERMVETEVRSRLTADLGASDMAVLLRHPLPEDEEFLTASVSTVQEMSAAIAPLARHLRYILLQSRPPSLNAIDMRRTLRRSLSHGGTPIELIRNRVHPPKPRLVILADISGSVASFATFALQLVFALRKHFSRQRSFVFVDGTDEVTDLIGTVHSITEATARINRERRGVWIDGHSDYGNAFATFVEHHLASVDAHTTVLVLGDGRNNYRSSGAEALATIHQRSSRLFWLNPEHPRLWNDGDAAMNDYAPHCDGVVECRTIRQLESFIQTLSLQHNI